ncbi:MAG: cytochrome c biogenesis protein ResB [Acidobacteria bacterium]|nr:cytochrome c biogenesis protein ResB [Acidobacteriota bacterium]
MMKKIWKFISGVQVTIWLTLAAIALLLIGSFYVKANKAGFNSLNHSLMQDWFREWGFQNLDKSWWFAALIGILFLLGVNTACCVLDRLAFHWNRRRLTGMKAFWVKVTPTIIHASFAFMLAGHFTSMGVGFRSRDMEFISRPGETGHYTLPEEVAMAVGEPECEFYSGPFAGRMRQCRISLQFTINGERVTEKVALAESLFWNGYQIHMSQIFANDQSEPYSTPDFQLLIKRDPGLRLIMICFPILILLTLFFYIGEKAINKNKTAA